MAQESIDILPTTRNLLDFSTSNDGDFGLEDFELQFIFDDVLLVEYIDISEDGGCVMKNGLYIPTNTMTKAWRKAKVILAGPLAKYAKVGDIVLFPHSLGVTVANVDVHGYGKLGRGVFLKEDKMFGICKAKVQNDSSDTGNTSPQ